MEYGIFNEVNFINGNVIVLNEGAKFDWLLNNFLKEGKDYKGLKKAMAKVQEAVNLSDEELAKDPSKFMKTSKRAIQIILDILAMGIDVVQTVGNFFVYINFLVPFTKFSPKGWLIWMIGFILTKLIDRLLRLAVDKAEFKQCKNEAEEVVKLLRDKADKTNDKDLKDKYREEADRLKKKIRYYSK